MWIAAGNEDKKLLDICSSVIVNYNSIGEEFVEADWSHVAEPANNPDPRSGRNEFLILKENET